MTQTQKFRFEQTSCSRKKIMSPEYSLKIKRWQGPPNGNKVKQRVCLFSWKGSSNEAPSPLIQITSQTPHSAPLHLTSTHCLWIQPKERRPLMTQVPKRGTMILGDTMNNGEPRETPTLIEHNLMNYTAMGFSYLFLGAGYFSCLSEAYHLTINY